MPRGWEARRGDRDEAGPALLFRALLGLAAAVAAAAALAAGLSNSLLLLLLLLPLPRELDVPGPLPRRDAHPRDDARGAVQGSPRRVVRERDGEAGLADGEGEPRREVEVERVAGGRGGGRCFSLNGDACPPATKAPTRNGDELTRMSPRRRSLHWRPRGLDLGRARHEIAGNSPAARRLHSPRHGRAREGGGGKGHERSPIVDGRRWF